MQYVPPFGATDPNASYVEGNPAAGLRGSFPTAPGFEAMMREIVNAISAFGLAPASGNLQQLAAAIRLGGKLIACTDASTAANAYVLRGLPPLADYEPMQTFVFLATFAATGPATIGVDGHGLLPLLRPDGSVFRGGEVVAGTLTTATLMPGATAVRLTAVPPSALATGEGIGLPGGKISFAFPGLIENDAIGLTDILAFYANAAEGGLLSGHHYKISFQALVAAILARISTPIAAMIPPQAGIPKLTIYNASGTFNPTGRAALLLATGAGGGGGGGTNSFATAGGSAGATAIKLLNLAGVGPLPVIVGGGGAGGLGVSGLAAIGGTGGTTSIGAVAVAGGGSGQQSGGGSTYRATVPGPGGIATAGDVLIPGGTGSTTFAPTDTYNFAGSSGGSSIFGGGGAGSYFTPYGSINPGQDGQAPGSGGGGASGGFGVSATGGDGADGLALALETY